jgi:hypothetical protein
VRLLSTRQRNFGFPKIRKNFLISCLFSDVLSKIHEFSGVRFIPVFSNWLSLYGLISIYFRHWCTSHTQTHDTISANISNINYNRGFQLNITHGPCVRHTCNNLILITTSFRATYVILKRYRPMNCIFMLIISLIYC